jgi:hypothetical protein
MVPLYVKMGFQCPICKVITEVEDELFDDMDRVWIGDLEPTCNTCEVERKL